MELYDIIKQLQQAKGSLEKQAILNENSGNFLLREYLRATYDPGIRYYQSKVETIAHKGFHEITPILITDLIENLAGRKVTGDAAKRALAHVMWELTAEGQELLSLLINRSVGASVGDTMVLKAFPGLYFLPPYQRCSLLDDKAREKFSSGKPFYVQTKCDGSFAYAVFRGDGTVDLITRQGSKYPKEFAEKICREAPVGGVFVGELEVYDNAGKLLDRKTGNGILNSILKEGVLPTGYDVVMTAWDLLTEEEFVGEKSVRQYSDRFERLQNWLIKEQTNQVNLVWNAEVSTLDEAFAIYQDHTSRGLEGCVIKLPTSLWKDGTAKDIVKLKLKFEVEMRCIDIYEGTGKAAGMLGGIVITTEDGEMECNCGSGFTDEQRKAYWANPGLIIQRVVSIEANDITQDRDTRKKPSLSLPIFCEVRSNDKTVSDTYARVLAQHEAAKQGK